MRSSKPKQTVLARLQRVYLNPALDFRVRLFNVLAIGGTAISLLMMLFGMLNEGGVFSVVTNLMIAVLSFALLTYSQKSGRYQLCYMITIAVIFLCLFPLLFFRGGGYHGGMPSFFVFAVVFTIFMLEGRKAVAFSVAELVVYIGCCAAAYRHPALIRFFAKEEELLLDVIIGFVSVSAALGVCMFVHFQLYNEQQRKLDAQNTILAESNRAKTQFLSNTSHEMRTPLTVISVNVQMVSGILKHMRESAGLDPRAAGLLADAQNEIMRLARMVGGMLTLASLTERTERSKVDLSALLLSTADLVRLLLSKRGNELETVIAEDLEVFGDADLLSQVILNLIQNAHVHTSNDTLRLHAAREGGTITITLRDNGAGISPDLLPHVFERGISGRKDGGGTGFGLFLSKTVVESHGGEIGLESEPGSGTTARLTLPVYEGQ